MCMYVCPYVVQMILNIKIDYTQTAYMSKRHLKDDLKTS